MQLRASAEKHRIAPNRADEKEYDIAYEYSHNFVRAVSSLFTSPDALLDDSRPKLPRRQRARNLALGNSGWKVCLEFFISAGTLAPRQSPSGRSLRDSPSTSSSDHREPTRTNENQQGLAGSFEFHYRTGIKIFRNGNAKDRGN